MSYDDSTVIDCAGRIVGSAPGMAERGDLSIDERESDIR